MLTNILLVVDIIAALVLIGLVLIQQGKGADAGAAFGSGASATVFGARGSQTFLSQATKYTAIVWFALTMSLVYLTRHSTAADRSVVDTVPAEQAPAATASTSASGGTAPTVAPADAPTTAPAAAPATAPAGTGGG